MSSSYDLQPVPNDRRSASTLDVALLFAGANVVTSTLITGGTLGLLGGSFRQLAAVALLGVLVGTLPIALLARLGPRTGLPTMVLLRRPFGTAGAATISILLVLTNFAWIALNNVVAAKAMLGILGGKEWAWSLTVGATATALALGGERTMALFDRLAVPLLAVLGALLTWRLLTTEANPSAVPLLSPGAAFAPLLALDLVVGYQISWSLMFADYTRFQARESQATRSVLLGLSASSLWLMIVGLASAQRGGGNDPTSMILGLGLPAAALLLVALSTITTNFVNLYLSALAIRNLAPKARALPTVVAVGVLGTALGLASSGFLDRYAAFMGTLATLLLPIVAIALVHFFWLKPAGQSAARWSLTALAAWSVGCATYQLCLSRSWTATLPTVLVTAITYAGLARWRRARTRAVT